MKYNYNTQRYDYNTHKKYPYVVICHRGIFIYHIEVFYNLMIFIEI